MHKIYICLIMDRCAFDEELIERAFTSEQEANTWGYDKCNQLMAKWRVEHPNENPEYFDPEYKVRAVQFADN